MSPLVKSDAKVQLLRSIPMFTKCTTRDLRQIAALTVALDLPKGEVLCREGELGTEFFVIIEGEAAVSVRVGAGPPSALADSAGRWRSWTAARVSPRSRRPPRRGSLSCRAIENLLTVSPEIALSLLKAMAHRLRDADVAQRDRHTHPPIGA